MKRFCTNLLGGALGAVLVAILLGPWVPPVESAYTPVPSGAILHRNSTTCWPGWSEVTAARGAYIVGLVAGGTLATAVGTVLTNQENRAAGVHGHGVTDGGHTHNARTTAAPAAGNSRWNVAIAAADATNGDGGTNVVTLQTTGLTVNNSAGTAGTNAPYLQYLTCSKN